MKSFANIITWVLHPVSLAIPAVYLIVLNSTGNHKSSLYWTFVALIFSLILSVFVLIGVKKGFFNNLDVSNRSQRVILYPFVIGIVIVFSLLVFVFRGPWALITAGTLFTLALLILDIVNMKIKASVHVASVSAIVIGIIYLYRGYSFLLLLFVPLVAWARIVEKRHTLKETIVGAVCGITLTVIAIFIVQLL